MKNNWQIKGNITESEKDGLSIQRDALLQKKRFVDSIDKFLQNAPKSQKKFNIDCNFLIKVSNIDNKSRLVGFLSLLDNKAILVDIKTRGGKFFWRNDPVEITVTNRFANYAKTVRDEYHRLDDLLRGEGKKTNYWQITNPFWLLYFMLKSTVSVVWRHKILSLLLALITLLGIDYTIAWKNTKFVVQLFNQILRLIK
ncbi:MAG: hypothetical protein AAB441_05130 [Patescibacteria group bacterium]